VVAHANSEHSMTTHKSIATEKWVSCTSPAMTDVGEANYRANSDLHPAFGQFQPRAAILVLCGEVGCGKRIVDEAAAGDAGLVGEEAEALPVKRRAAARAEEAVVSGVAVLRVDAHLARLRDDLVVGKIRRPPERAAGAPLAAVAMTDAVKGGVAFDLDRTGTAA